MADPIILEFIGTIGKKNKLRPSKNGGFHYDPETKALLDALGLQVPSWARDLNLISPDVVFQQYYTNAKSDRDNAITSMLDVLTKYSVIKDDCIFNFNGTLTILPAIKSDSDGMTVTLLPREQLDLSDAPPAPRYIDPRRQRMMKRLQSPPISQPQDDLHAHHDEDYPDWLQSF